jgi:hypothetical protein
MYSARNAAAEICRRPGNPWNHGPVSSADDPALPIQVKPLIFAGSADRL